MRNACHRFPRHSRRTTLMIAAALLSGCQALHGGGVVASKAPADLAEPASSAVARDLVPRLAEHVGSAGATVVLKSDGSVFGSSLEHSLRSWGYAVTTDEKLSGATAIRLAYVLIPFDGQILARLSTGSVEIGRVYITTSTGASPASPVTVMRHD